MNQKNPLLTDPHNLNTMILPFRDRVKCLFTGWCHDLDELICWEYEQGGIDSEEENRAIRREYDVKYRAKKKAELEAQKIEEAIKPSPPKDDLLDLIESPSLFALNTDHMELRPLPPDLKYDPANPQFVHTKDGLAFTGDIVIDNPTPEQVREDSEEMSDVDAAADFDVTGTKVGNERRQMTPEEQSKVVEEFTKSIDGMMKQAIDFRPDLTQK